MIQQPQMKAQFRASVCERSHHLCVAPIFVWGERALWVIVDLVDYNIVGLRATMTVYAVPFSFTLRAVSEQQQVANFGYDVERDGWVAFP